MNLRATGTTVSLSVATAVLVLLVPDSWTSSGTSRGAPASPAELFVHAPDSGLSGLLGSQPGAAFVSLVASVRHVSGETLRMEPVGSVGVALLAAATTFTSVRRRRRARASPSRPRRKITAEDLALAFRRADRGASWEGLTGAPAQDVLHEVGPLNAWPAPPPVARRPAWHVAPPARGAWRVLESGTVGEESAPQAARPSRQGSDRPLDLDAQILLCAALFSGGRFTEVAELAREALGQHPGDDRLLVHLSRATFQLGREDEALDWAVQALRTRRSRPAVIHLIRLLALTRRFQPGDRERLHLALDRHPQEPLLLHAAGIFESMHGCRRAAHRLLLAALRHETNGEMQREIARELARIEEPATADRVR